MRLVAVECLETVDNIVGSVRRLCLRTISEKVWTLVKFDLKVSCRIVRYFLKSVRKSLSDQLSIISRRQGKR